jgi:hypothetical protein
MVFLVAMLTGCSSFLHWSPSALPDVAALCAFSGDVEPQLEALAAEYGVPVAFVKAAFEGACSETAKTAPNDAKHAGLSAARASASAAKKAGAKFEAKP